MTRRLESPLSVEFGPSAVTEISGFYGKLLFPNCGRSDKICHNLWLDMKPREDGVVGQILLSAINDNVSWNFFPPERRAPAHEKSPERGRFSVLAGRSPRKRPPPDQIAS
jgi:hypothetical protein